jgi:hypothetical protein
MADVRDLARLRNQTTFERVSGTRSGRSGLIMNQGELRTEFDYFVRGSVSDSASTTQDAVTRLQGSWTNDPKKQYFVTITDTDGHPNLELRAERAAAGEAQLRIINREPSGVAEVTVPLGPAPHLDAAFFAPERFTACGPIEKLEISRKDDVFGMRINDRYIFGIQPEDGRFFVAEDTGPAA